MSVGIIIQARMGSSRLPGKILMDFSGKTLLQHILDRLGRLQTPATTVIATTLRSQDDIVEAFCKEHGVLCFRGDEENVLKRYCDCTDAFLFHQVVRMTGDNPFPDIEELDRLIGYHLENHMDFSENFSTLPIGIGMEIMSRTALVDSLRHADLPKHFEHVDEYILDHLEDYRHGTLGVSGEKCFPSIRLTVDTVEDYRRACFILRVAGTNYVTTAQAIALGRQFDVQSKLGVDQI